MKRDKKRGLVLRACLCLWVVSGTSTGGGGWAGAVMPGEGVGAGAGRPLAESMHRAAAPLVPNLDVASDAPPGELLVMSAADAVTWEQVDGFSPTGTVSVLQLGAVGVGTRAELEIDRTRLSAQSAIVWISKAPGSVVDSQLVRIALLGDAKLEQDGVTRSGQSLYVTAVIRGSIRVNATNRAARDESAGETYKVAENLRSVAEPSRERLGSAVVSRPLGEKGAVRELTSENVRRSPVRFTAGSAPTVQTPEGKMAVLLSGGATIFQRSEKGDFLELRAQRAVLFTNVTSLTELDEAQNASEPRDVITGAYLEGDVRISYLPGKAGGLGEQRLEANRAFYDFTNERAMMTDAVLHTSDPTQGLPIVMRARTVEQITRGQYKAEKVELSTSSFAVPTYSVRASRMYVKENPATYQGDRARTTFQGDDLTLNVLGAPFFYLPVAGGDSNTFPLRSIAFESSDRFGFGLRTEWGLYETFGQPHPKDLDIAYRADFLGKRGPATGIDADYRGGLVTGTTAEPWNFAGKVRSYILHEGGSDIFNGDRREIEPNQEIRGKFLFEHQHFLPEDWQVQIRSGYASDPTFLEQYFQNEFGEQLPYELAFYAKRQKDSEQLSILATTSLNNFPTAAEVTQEQAVVQRYPEIAYRRVGESVGDDRFTFFSDNVVSAVSFKNFGGSRTVVNGITYIVPPDNQAYQSTLTENNISAFPGLASYGQTGTPEDTTLRGDFRQQLDYPLQAGQFKVVPYVLGRYTPYSESVNGGSENRIYAATGARVMTTFWQTDDTIESELFDVHRVRHIVEPIVNVYTAGTTVDSTKLYIYDEQVDSINDVTAAQLRLEQRWQTKRGGAGRWRSVDFVTLNVEGNFFTNQPDENTFLRPNDFRGLWFPSLPETSVARSSINADTSWRVSDTMIVVADEQYNVDENRLATAAAGLAVQRSPRVSYYVEQRYIEPLNSNITSVSVGYELSSKYQVMFSQSYDFSQTNNVSSSVTVNRKFDRLTASVTAYSDSVNDETGLRFLLLPEGVNSRGPSSFFGTLQPPGGRR